MTGYRQLSAHLRNGSYSWLINHPKTQVEYIGSYYYYYFIFISLIIWYGTQRLTYNVTSMIIYTKYIQVNIQTHPHT